MFVLVTRMALCALLLLSCGAYATDPVGRLGGSFAVSPSGQAGYEIPLAVPAGTGGLAPGLSLRYTSTTALGSAGVGWSLSGLSAVTRCSHTKVLDGAYNVDVTLTATDKLCLDGQRLLSGGVASNQTSAGWLGTATVYTTQLQSYQKITATLDTANQQPQQFTVLTKDGRTLTYGGNTNSRVVASSRYDSATSQEIPTAQILSWLLTRVQDRHGNTIHYTYTQDAANSSAVLASITYTENTTVSPALPAKHLVEFDYTAHHVQPHAYVAGSRVRSNKLLSAIRISSGDVAGQNVIEVRRYTLTYRSTDSRLSRRPLLDSVQQCETRGGTQKCLKPTTLTWNDAVPEFNRAISGPAWADGSGSTSTKWNCNGSVGTTYCTNGIQVDGTANTWNGDPSYFSTIQYSDIDGDGRTDICGRTSAGMQCHLSTGNGFSPTALSAPAWSNAGNWNLEKHYATIQFADINGDGKSDLCGRSATGLVCHLSQGASGFAASPVTSGYYTDAAGWGDTTKKYYYTLRFFDLDQDGRSDVCGVGPSGLLCYYIRSDTNGNPTFVAATAYNQIANAPPVGMLAWTDTSLDFQQMVPVLMPMNLNRSRDLALCARGLPTGSGGSASTNGHLMCIVPTSGGVTAATMFDLDMTGVSGSVDWRTVRIVDVNGDGWPDMCGSSVTDAACVKSNGQGGLLGMNGFSGFVAAFATESTNNGSPTKRFWEQMTGYIWLNVLAIDSSAPVPPANTPAWTYYQVSTAAKGLPHYSTLRYVDVNADGLTDVCERAPDGFHCRVQRRLPSNWICQKFATATGDADTAQSCNGGAIYEQQNLNPIFGTNDGYFDAFAYRIDLPVAWSDWTSAGQPTDWDLPQHFQTIDMVDVTGDGLPDVCGRDITGIKCYASERSPRDLVTAIEDGYGQRAQITYKPLTDASVYTRGTAAVYPDVDLQPGALVVSAVEMDNGVGSRNRMSYRYAGLVTNVDYGWQGFASTEVRDETSGKLTVSTYRQAFPYTGMVEAVSEKFCPTVLTPSADCFVLAQRAVSGWGQKNVLPAPYTGILPYTTQTTETRWDLPSGAAVGTGGELVTASQTALSVNVNPVVVGGSVTLTAQVSNGLPSPATGTVTFLADGAGSLGSANLSGGTATLTTSFATSGTRNLRAVYSGNSASGGSTSGVTSLVVNPGSSGVTLAVSPAGLIARTQTVTLTATVTGQSPTGTVTFKDGSTTLGTGTLNASGMATFSTSWSVNGTHSLTAAYSGDANNASMISSASNRTVGTVTPTVAIAATPNPGTMGNGVTVTATLTGGYNPTGTVTFKNGSTTLGTGTVNGSGVASAMVQFAAAGNASLTAEYGGNSQNATATSPALPFTVSKRTASIGLSGDPAIIGINNAVTLIATLTNTGSTVPTGSVVFKEGATTLGTGTLSGGVASITKTWTSAGTKVLTLEYAGDSNFSAMTADRNFVVRGATPAIALATSPASGILASTSVTLTATITVGSSPTGNVTFRSGSTVLGTSTISAGTATLAKKFDVGTHSLTATYNGDANNGAKTSAAVSRAAAKASPTLTVAVAPSSGIIGQNVTLTATLASASQAPTGTVTFKDGAATIGTATVSGLTASVQVPFTTLGSHSLTAVYAGDANNNSVTSSAAALTVNKRTPSLSLAASPSQVLAGASVTLTATLTGYNPSGTVTFKEGTTTLGTGTITSGIATLTTSFATAGSKSLTAEYVGDASNNAVTSSSAALSVKSVTSSISLAANPAVVGQAFTATATVTGSSPTGTVQFYNNGVAISGAATVSSGAATKSITITSAGAQSLTATYSGDTNHMPATSAPLPIQVSKAGATVAVVLSPNPVQKGQNVTATATVLGYLPTGTVTVMSGSVVMSEMSLDPATSPRTATGQAVFYVTGTYPISVIYSGDGNNTSNDSPSAYLTVSPTATLVSLTASPSPAIAGQQVMLSAGINAGGATPSGTVTFKEGGTTLGTTSVQGSTGAYYAQLPYTFATVGTRTLTATYTGANGPATSPAASLVVTKAQPLLTLAISSSSAVVGQSITLSANIVGSSPGGGVTFKDGSTTLGTGTISGGVATLTTSFAAAGSKNLSAEYSGDANNLSAASDASALNVALAAPTLSLSATPSPTQVGQSTALVATLSGGASPSGVVTFKRGGTILGTAVISSGVATFERIFNGIGIRNLTAEYAGDAGNLPAASGTVALPVVQATPTLTLSANPDPAVISQNVTLSATLSNGSFATGAIVFKDGAATLGTGAISNGVATLTTSFASIGGRSLTAEYAGDISYAAATGGLALTVGKAVPTVVLTANPSPVTLQANTTLTAMVSGGLAPSGSVTFKDGQTTLGTATLSGGVATLVTAFSTAGSKSLTAEYGGNANNAVAASAPVALTVSKIQPQVSWSFSPASPSTTDMISMTVTVAGMNPTGTVEFYRGPKENPLRLCEIVDYMSGYSGGPYLSNGTVSCALYFGGGFGLPASPAFGPGVNQYFVRYVGDGNNLALESDLISLTVTKGTPTVALSITPTPVVVGDTVTLTATPSQYVGGSVTFKDGATVLGSASLSWGSASISTSFPSIGSRNITAVYDSTQYNQATSPVVVLPVIAKSTPTVTLTATPNPAATTQSVALTATISGGYGTPSGTVTFKDGSTTLGTGTISGGVATFNSSFATTGTKSLTAVYGGDYYNNTATSAVRSLTVAAKVTPSISLAASPTPVVRGASLTLTATLAGGFNPSGTVTFKRGTTTLGTGTVSNNVATLTTSIATAGSYTLTATYNGDTKNNTATSSGVGLTVTAVFREVKEWLFALFSGEDPPANDGAASTGQEAA